VKSKGQNRLNFSRSDIVLMEWTRRELYFGVYNSDDNTVMNCQKTIGRINESNEGHQSNADFFICPTELSPGMLRLNAKDIQADPDMNFLIWRVEIEDGAACTINEVDQAIQIADHVDFMAQLLTHVQNYV
jgi:hypothetical protein